MDVYYIDWLNIVKFFHFVTIQQGIEYKDKIMMCISFAGLFATFGGAYLGAKISGIILENCMSIKRMKRINI